MNERIQELFEQVADNLDPEDCMVSEEFLETFTELIVRECAQVANDSNQSKNRAVGVSVGDVIRKHFGVKG